MSHPIQPHSYMEINNFYTATVYNKGAEVVRMIQTLLGERGFRRGMDLYFASHDGEAATTEDFLRAMEDATGFQLRQFRRWYSQAGTPRLGASSRYAEDEKCLHLTLRQRPPSTADPDLWAPLHIPVSMALLDNSGAELPLRLEGENEPVPGSRVLELKEEQQTFRFADIEQAPVLSVLRNFSAPVALEFEQAPSELAFLMAHDTDSFNRWDAGQRLVTTAMLARLHGDDVTADLGESLYVEGLLATLRDDQLDAAMVSQALSLPLESELARHTPEIDVDGIHRVRSLMMDALAAQLQEPLKGACERHADWAPADYGARATAGRSLFNTCLSYLVHGSSDDGRRKALERVEKGRNLTEQLGALRALVHAGCNDAGLALEIFEKRWSRDPLVLDKWFTVQATAPVEGSAKRVAQLLQHPCFDLRNPNRTRSLLGAFGDANPFGFHARDGGGYRLICDKVMELDKLNPSTAARLVAPLTRWQRYDRGRQELMLAQLERIAVREALSKNVYELVNTSLEKSTNRRQA